MSREETTFEGLHASLAIGRPARAVVVIRIAGTDVGELGELPFRELAKDLETNESLRLFIDARAASGPSIDVSGRWADWLGKHQRRFARITMLAGSRFVEFTAAFVRDFSGLRDRMEIVTDAATFDAALRASCGGPGSRESSVSQIEHARDRPTPNSRLSAR